MRIWIAGKESTEPLGEEIAKAAEALRHADYAAHIDGVRDILALREAENTAGHLSRYITLLRRRQNVDPSQYTQPRGPGLKGLISYRARMLLWRIVRYQHFWMAFQQNGINTMQAEALDFEHQERTRKTAELEARIEQLEQTIAALNTRGL